MNLRLDSMTVRSAVAGIVGVLAVFGVSVAAEDQTTITEGVMALVSLGALGATWYHRVNRKAP